MSGTSKNNMALTRLASLFDDGAFVEIDTESGDGARTAYGNVGGATVFAFCQDSTSSAGAVDAAQAKKLRKVYDLAAKTGSPVVAVFDSKGVRMKEPFASLTASSEMLRMTAELSGVVPQVAVVLGPCGGFSALAAAMADVTIISEKGELFLTPAFTDKAAGGKTQDVGSQEYALKSGAAAIGCDGETAALAKASEVVRLLPLNNISALPVLDFAEPAPAPEGDILASVCDAGSVIELYAAMGRASRTVLATLGGMPCGLIAVEGELCREDTAKCARLAEMCDAFNLPIVSLVNSGGFWKSADNDLNEGIRNAARLGHVLAEATSPKISVVTGSAIGAIYSVFCGANGGCDMTYAWNSAVISPMAPEAAASLLWEDRITKSSDIAALGAEYAATEVSAQKAAEAGAVEAVIAPQDTRGTLIGALDMLSSKRVSRTPKKHGNMPL